MPRTHQFLITLMVHTTKLKPAGHANDHIGKLNDEWLPRGRHPERRPTPCVPVDKLSAEQLDELRRNIRVAAALSHTQLARACSSLMRRFAISYRELQQVADVPLPDFLAGTPKEPRPLRNDPTPEVTAEQAADLLDAYRNLLSTTSSAAATRKLLAAFDAQFGVPIYKLKRVLTADESNNPHVYAELAEGREGLARQEAQRKAEEKRLRKRAQGASASKSRRKSGKSRRSVWTISGGLPGLGRNN